MADHHIVAAKAGIDVIAGIAVTSAWLGWLPGVLPDIAAVLGIVWYLVQLWESKTVQRWLKHRHKDGA